MARYCPHCGADVSEEEETEIGIICPTCCTDFWSSEALEDAPNKWALRELDGKEDNREWGNRA